jgi:hypothetical protein
MRRLATVLPLLVLAAILAGSATGASKLERHAIASEGMSFAVPASWLVVDSRLPADVVDRLARENPKLAPFVSGLRSPGSPMKFIALDPALTGGFATNANVVAAAVPSSMTFDSYRRGLVLEIRHLVPKGPVAQKTVTIHGARAVRVGYHLRLRVAGKALTVQTLQYAFLRNGRSVVVTYTTLPKLAGRYARTFASSAATIRFS